MSVNPLKLVETKKSKLSAQEWCDRGNRILAGQIPMEHGKNAGQFIRRDDVHWVLRDGRCVIDWAS